MKVHSLIIIFVVAGLLLSGCSKTEPVEPAEPAGKVTIRAGVPEEVEGNSKTVLDIATRKVRWATDETIQLVCPGIEVRTFYPFTIDTETISEDGKFAGFTGDLEVPDGYLVAAFVGGAKGNRTDKTKPGWYNTSSTSTTTGLRYPHKQIYSEGGPRAEYIYMIADPMYNTGLQDIHFRHLVSIINIPVKQSSGTPVTLKSITVKCSGKPISGCFYGGLLTYGGDGAPNYQWVEGAKSVYTPISINVSTKPSIMVSGGEYGDTIILQDSSGNGTIGQPLSETPQNFYIVTAPGNHGYLTITLTDSEGHGKSLWVTKNTVTTVAGKVYYFPALEWASIGPDVSGTIIDLINTEQDEDIW